MKIFRDHQTQSRATQAATGAHVFDHCVLMMRTFRWSTHFSVHNFLLGSA